MSETERMGRADTCPDCCTNTETPRGIHEDGPDHFVAGYLCHDCGHAWTTSWRDK